MKMFSLWWILFSAVSAFSFLGIPGVDCANSDTTAFPVIPNHLLDCYIDDGIYHRANRMPSSLEYFLDLIRKVENSPTSRNINARELSMVLLQYLKLDGIQTLRSHTKYLPNNILPFAPSGDMYFKHRLMLVGLIPKVDRNYLNAINESLTKEEMCNLHFMLSYSIDPYKREDERCSGLFEETKWSQPDPRFDWSHNGRQPHHRYGRNRRSVEVSEKSNWIDLEKKHKEALEKSIKKRIAEATGNKLENLREDHRLLVEDQPLRNKRSDDKKSEVETIASRQTVANGASSSEKDKFTIGDQELLSASEFHPKGLQSLVQTQNFGRHGGRYPPKKGASLEDGIYSGIVPGIPLSDCPVVNGIVKTPYGSLLIGSVISGIAAGLNPEEIPPTKLSVDPSELESPSDRVKNVWAATIAGSVADVISSSALLDMDNLQIIKGGWNDTFDFKWYLLNSNQFMHLPEVVVRGSLDGLILGLSVREWTSKFSSFKLSQILQTYYECYWESTGARNRVELSTKLAPEDIFRKQVHLMSLVLKKQKMNVLTVLDYNHIAREAVGKVIQHIHNMEDGDKSYLGSFPTINTDNFVNLVAVIDSSWEYENLFKIFQILRSNQVAATPESELTVMCGSDGKVLLSTQNSVDLYTRFTKDMLFTNCSRGMNFPLVFDAAETLYRKLYSQEKTGNQINIEALVLLLIPFENVLHENVDYVTEKSRNFRQAFPDVRLMIAANGRTESFVPLVKGPQDLFPISSASVDPSMKYTKALADGIKLSYQRVTKPSCGSYFNDENEGLEGRVSKDLLPGTIAYFRLLPQYFFTVKGQAVVAVRSKLRAPLTVCHSREVDRPVGPTPRNQPRPDFPNPDNPYRREYPGEFSARQIENGGPVECKTITGEVYRIELNNPCEGASTLADCRPLYISLTAPLQESNSIFCQNCRLPKSIQYEITASGLTCYNSASAIYLSSFSLALLFILLLSNNQKLL